MQYLVRWAVPSITRTRRIHLLRRRRWLSSESLRASRGLRNEPLRGSAKLRRHLRPEQRYALRLLLAGEGEIGTDEQAALLMLARALGEQLLDGDELATLA